MSFRMKPCVYPYCIISCPCALGISCRGQYAPRPGRKTEKHGQVCFQKCEKTWGDLGCQFTVPHLFVKKWNSKFFPSRFWKKNCLTTKSNLQAWLTSEAAWGPDPSESKSHKFKVSNFSSLDINDFKVSQRIQALKKQLWYQMISILRSSAGNSVFRSSGVGGGAGHWRGDGSVSSRWESTGSTGPLVGRSREWHWPTYSRFWPTYSGNIWNQSMIFDHSFGTALRNDHCFLVSDMCDSLWTRVGLSTKTSVYCKWSNG